MKSWYEIKAQADGLLEVNIFDEIGGWGIRFIDFARELDSYPNIGQIHLRINSPGGSIEDGTAMYNLLREHPANKKVTVYGVANSIASVVAMVGNPVIMPENTTMFIHEGMLGILGWFHGDALREMADFIEKFTPGLVSAYRRKTGLSDDKIMALLSAGNTVKGTLLTAQEAKELGFADEVSDPIKLAARFDIARLKEIPQLAAISDKFTTNPVPDSHPSAREIRNSYQGYNDFGFTAPAKGTTTPVHVHDYYLDPEKDGEGYAYTVADHSHRITPQSLALGQTEPSDGHIHELVKADQAQAILEKISSSIMPTPAPTNETPEQLHAQLTAEANSRAREIYDLCTKVGVPDAANEFLNRGMTVDQVKERLAEAPAIRDACAAAKLPARAASYIKAGMTLKEVRSELFEVLKAREVHIDNQLGPEGDRVQSKPVIDAGEIYALRRKVSK